jgi:hypothetical protein
MSIVSTRAAESTLTKPVVAVTTETSTLTVVDVGDLDAFVESLGGDVAIDASPYVAELVRVIRNALAHHMRVVVQVAPVGPSDAELRESRDQLEQMIDQMTPELSLPTEAKVRQARRNAEARTQLILEFGALTGDQIGREHSQARNRHALAARWRKEGRVFGVPYRGQMLYPAFQFDPASGAVRGEIRKVLRALPRDRMSAWECALWWTAANGWLGGRRPVDALNDDPDDVVAAAAHLGEPPGL